MALLRSSFKIGTLFLYLLVLTVTAEQTQPPCDLSETVYIDKTTITPDGSYLHNGIIVPANETWEYNYRILVGNERVPIDKQLRGCICKYRPCISVCCPYDGEFHNKTCNETPFEISPLINITTKQGKTIAVNITEQFVIQYYRPCNDLYYYMPEMYDVDNYTIMEDGSLLRFEDGTYHAKKDYCLSPRVLDNQFLYTPLQCYSTTPNASDIERNSIALMISVPFMLLTIIVYLMIPDLRTIHGLSLCCYLGGLSVGYSILVILNSVSNIESFGCAFLGYTAYFAFMSSFFWLSVISFDLFANIHGSGTNQKMKQFRLYCLYAWGLALIFLICTHIAQHSDFIPISWKSGIGSDKYCFLNMETGWSAAIYFYGPILFIVCYNIVMFVLTFIQIRQGMKLAAYNKGPHKPHHEHRSIFMAFLRLFIIMGITWIAEILSYMAPKDSWSQNIFRYTDLLNGIQGVIIFILFVCRKSVRNKLLQKFGKKPALTHEQTQELSQCI